MSRRAAAPPERPSMDAKQYNVVGPDPARGPDYGRVVKGLTAAELAEELAGGRGEPGYRAALQAEAESRAGARTTTVR